MHKIVEHVVQDKEEMRDYLNGREDLTQYECYKTAVKHYKKRCFNWHQQEVQTFRISASLVVVYCVCVCMRHLFSLFFAVWIRSETPVCFSEPVWGRIPGPEVKTPVLSLLLIPRLWCLKFINNKALKCLWNVFP